MSKTCFGIDNLTEKLKGLFYQYLKQFLPSIYTNLKIKIDECESILSSLGDLPFSDNLMITINTLVHKFSDKIEQIFSGKIAISQLTKTNKLDEELNILPLIKEKHSQFLKDFRSTYKPSSYLNVILIK